MISAINAIGIFLLFIGSFVLQFFLSKSESRWPGLVLPLLNFMFSLFYITIFTVAVPEGGGGFGLPEAIILFLVYNVTTVIFMTIYGSCRGKRRKQQALDKMTVQDLE
ncbi:MAG: hypothetical protein FWG00_04140 [Coriobacteriia bacterium]|nr:hypothetical protein [Coriobacteriia bacterium]